MKQFALVGLGPMAMGDIDALDPATKRGLQAQRQQALAATEFEVLDAVPQAPPAPIALPHEP